MPRSRSDANGARAQRWDVVRPLRHWMHHPVWAARVFSPSALSRIEQAISTGERTHHAQLCVVIEARLGLAALRARLTPRQRALQVFSEQHVWDTEGNNGVLLYLLLADRAVEIVTDRAARRAIEDGRWAQVCQALSQACSQGQWVEGTLQAVVRIHGLLAQAFPDGGNGSGNELSDRPQLI